MSAGDAIRVYIVDDDALVLDCFQGLLTYFGIKVRYFERAFDAIDNAARDKPAVVITDLNMPDMTGFQLAKKLIDLDPEIRIFVMSGYSPRDVYVHQGIEELGEKVEFFRKPPDFRQMLDRVKAILDG